MSTRTPVLFLLVLTCALLSAGFDSPQEAIEAHAQRIVEAGEAHAGDCASMAEAAAPHVDALADALIDLIEAHRDDPQALAAVMEGLEDDLDIESEALDACEDDPAMQAIQARTVEKITQALKDGSAPPAP